MDLSTSQPASRLAEFAATVAAVEIAARRRLAGPGLVDCEEAFADNAEGFQACVARAIEKHRAGKIRDPLGVLVCMVRAGEHCVPAPEDQAAARNRCGCTHPECVYQDRCQRTEAA